MITIPIKDVTSDMLSALNERGVSTVIRSWAQFHGLEHTFKAGTNDTDPEISFVSGKYAGLGVQISSGGAAATWVKHTPEGEFEAMWFVDVEPKRPLSKALNHLAKIRTKETK